MPVWAAKATGNECPPPTPSVTRKAVGKSMSRPPNSSGTLTPNKPS